MTMAKSALAAVLAIAASADDRRTWLVSLPYWEAGAGGNAAKRAIQSSASVMARVLARPSGSKGSKWMSETRAKVPVGPCCERRRRGDAEACDDDRSGQGERAVTGHVASVGIGRG